MTLDSVEHFTAEIQRGANKDECIFSQAHPVDGDINVVATAGRVQPASDVFTAGGGNKAFDVEEQVFAPTVVTAGAKAVSIQAVESNQQRKCFDPRDDALLGEHHGVGIIHFDHVIEEEPLGIFKKVRQHVGGIVCGRKALLLGATLDLFLINLHEGLVHSSIFSLSEILEIELEAELEQAAVQSGWISLCKIGKGCQQVAGCIRGNCAVNLKDALDVEDIDE